LNVIPRFFSKTERDQGWAYFLLDPGVHYLAFIGPQTTDMWSWTKQLEYASRWFIDIPIDTPIVYIGTLHLYCRSRWYIFEGQRCDYFDEGRMVVQNEAEQAQQVVSQVLSGLEQPDTVLMQRYDSPTIILKTPKRPKSSN